jgi:hypothetical protein
LKNYNELIPILSLIIAGIAVFFGPLISIYVTRKTLRTNSKIATKNLISPIRQEWINDLRSTLIELTSKSAHYMVSGTEDRKDSEYYRITELEHKIKLLINPLESDHILLVESISEMTTSLYKGGMKNESFFWKKHKRIITISQKILKREWERVKNDI